MNSPLRTAAKHGFVPPFVPPFRFVPPLWIQIQRGDGHTKPAGGKVMLPASWPPAPAAQCPSWNRRGGLGCRENFQGHSGVCAAVNVCVASFCAFVTASVPARGKGEHARLNFQPCFSLADARGKGMPQIWGMSVKISWARARGKGLDFKSDPFNLGWTSNLTKPNRPRPLGACAAGLPIWISNLIGPFAHARTVRKTLGRLPTAQHQKPAPHRPAAWPAPA